MNTLQQGMVRAMWTGHLLCMQSYIACEGEDGISIEQHIQTFKDGIVFIHDCVIKSGEAATFELTVSEAEIVVKKKKFGFSDPNYLTLQWLGDSIKKHFMTIGYFN